MSVTLRPAGTWKHATDRIVLAAHERRLRRRRLVSQGGVELLLDLPAARTLRPGDALETAGGLVEIVAAVEPLAQVGARDAAHLAALAWHVGNRHLPAQVEHARILIARDPVIERMLEGLGATLAHVEAPFHPLHGAYHDHGSHGHGHGHDHG